MYSNFKIKIRCILISNVDDKKQDGVNIETHQGTNQVGCCQIVPTQFRHRTLLNNS